MTLKSVYLLVYEDKEGGGDVYHRIFSTLELAQKAMWEIKDDYMTRELDIARNDFIDEPTYVYMVDQCDVEINKLSVEYE